MTGSLRECGHPEDWPPVRGCPVCNVAAQERALQRHQASLQAARDRKSALEEASDKFESRKKSAAETVTREDERVYRVNKQESSSLEKTIKLHEHNVNIAKQHVLSERKRVEDLRPRAPAAFQEAADNEHDERDDLREELTRGASSSLPTSYVTDPPPIESDTLAKAIDRTTIPATLDHIIDLPMGFHLAMQAAKEDGGRTLQDLQSRAYMSPGATWDMLGKPSVADARAPKTEEEIRKSVRESYEAHSTEDLVFFQEEYVKYSDMLLSFFRANSTGIVVPEKVAPPAASTSEAQAAWDDSPDIGEQFSAMKVSDDQTAQPPKAHAADCVIPAAMPPVPQDRTFKAFIDWLREWEAAAGGQKKLKRILKKEWLAPRAERIKAIRAACAKTRWNPDWNLVLDDPADKHPAHYQKEFGGSQPDYEEDK